MTLMAKLEATINERDALAEQNDRIRQLLLKLKRMQFGAKFERLPEAQLQLGLEALEQAIARGEAEAEKRDPDLRKDGVAKRRASRGALPAHLPRIEVTLAPEDTACPCCKVAMTVIGEDSSERLDVVPAHIHANALLGGYRGILQCDGYAAYKKLVRPKQHEHAVTLVFCWSHVHDNRLGN